MKYLKLKKTSPEEEERRRKKMKEGTRVALNERRLKTKLSINNTTTFNNHHHHQKVYSTDTNFDVGYSGRR